MKITKRIESEIKQILSTYWDSYMKGDLKTWASYIQDDSRNIGTTQEEIWNSKEEIVNYTRAVIDQMVGNAELRNMQTQIIPFDPHIMAHELADLYIKIENKWDFYAKIRLSSLLKITDSGWKIIHQHGSYPDSRTQQGETLAFEKINKENLELRDAVKRRTVELESKNRELEIEAALEKVRAISMGMKNPDDMLDVCKTISLQLQELGVKEIRNVQTAIFYEHRSSYMNYEFYAKHKKTFITETTYTNHEVHQEFATKMMKGKGEIFITHIKGKEVKDWIAYQKTTNVFIDKYLEAASSLNYYWFSLGPVALGISTYLPLTEAETNLFNRFLKVFELAYQRYLDIEKAQAQAREAKIELSLERIRAQATAMKESADLLDIVVTMRSEFSALGHEAHYFWHMRWLPDKYEKAMTSGDGTRIGMVMDLPRGFHGNAAMIKWEKNNDPVGVFAYDVEGAIDYVDRMIKTGRFHEIDPNAPGPDDIRAIGGLTFIMARTTHGEIGYSLPGVVMHPPPEDLATLIRFAGVFDLAYRRFEDLKEAEAQAREAQIELALERVRARTMAMQQSDELKDTALSLFQQVKELGIPAWGCGFNIWDEDKKAVTSWNSSEGQIEAPIKIPSAEDIFLRIYQAAQKGESTYVEEMGGKALEAHYRYMATLPGVSDILNQFSEAGIVLPTFQIFHIAYFSHGYLMFITYEAVPEARDIFKRYAKVFEQTYTRFLDLQKAEAQAREAQIEAALESVRSRTMGMQKSEELKEVIQIVYEQFVHLNIHIEHTGFIMDYKARDDMHIWLADQNGAPSQVTIPYFDSPHWNSFIEAKAKGMDFFANQLPFKEKNRFYRKLFKFIPDLPEDTKKFYLGCPGLAISTVLLENVGLYIENFSGIPYSDEENNTLMRFGKVFQQTYTRFNDLKQAEAQAREAQIENALEKVRSRTMAMQRSEELPEAANNLFLQVQALGIPAWSAGYCIWNDEDKSTATACMSSEGVIQKPFVLPTIGEGYNFYEHLHNGRTFYVEELGGEALVKHYEFMRTLPIVGEVLDGIIEAGFPLPTFQIFHIVYFPQGYLMFITYEPVPDAHDIFKRFSKVFEQTYTRFLDLQKAEAQARETQIELALERVRSRTMAMHNSNDVGDTVVTLFDEVLKLGIDKSIRCGIGILEGTELMETWSATSYPNGEIDLKMGLLDMTIHPLLIGLKKAWNNGKKGYTYQLKGKDVIRYYKALNNEPEYPFHIDIEKLPDNIYHNSFFYSEGILFAFTSNPVSEEAAKVLDRFAGVFGQTYTRYLDLKKAEAQAHEAQIEAALERVRAKAMAMHKSDDLTSAVASVFSELDRLGFKTVRCGIGIFNDQSKKVNVWTASPGDKSELTYVSGDEILERHPLLDGIYKSWQSQVDFTYELKGKDLTEYYKVVSNSNLPVKGPGVNSRNTSQHYHCAFFPAGGLFAFREMPFTSEVKHLMRRFADVFQLTFTRHLDLQKAEAQNKIIQAENERKTNELEEARALQLAMLPKQLPKLDDLEIAVFMKTATEVGGDYYDFCINDDDSLNICLGDATGHGMKAGIMVSAMKSIFTTNAPKMDIEQFISYANSGIKSMNLKRMMMGFIMLNINKNRFRIINAGMPPIFLYRKNFDAMDEIIVHGMPIGAMNHSTYNVTDLSLQKGDVILLLSDGMPELQNEQNEMYGYNRIRNGFKKVAGQKPDEIINYLKDEGSAWVGDKDPDDDVTFVVIKVK